MNDRSVLGLARDVLQAACDADFRLVTAESCAGGLLSAALPEMGGLSHAFEQGFVVFTDAAKREVLGVDGGTLERSRGDVAVSITGYADAPADANDAGLVHFGVYAHGYGPRQFEERFEDNG